MNSTKKYLIITAIIFNILAIGGEIYKIVSWFQLTPDKRSPVFYVVFMFIDIAICIAIAVLLSMAIWKNGVLFRQRYGLYMTALVMSIIVNLLSVSSVLLIITMFISDWVWVKPEKEKQSKDETTVKVDNVEVITKSKEEKIAQLRKLKEEGKITEEQYQEELFKLL